MFGASVEVPIAGANLYATLPREFLSAASLVDSTDVQPAATLPRLHPRNELLWLHATNEARSAPLWLDEVP